MAYHPPQKILDNYADVLVNFALNSGKGVKKGEVVYLGVPECAKPLLVSLHKAVLKAGAHSIINYIPDDMGRIGFELAKSHQLDFFPEHALRGKAKQMDHSISIIAETDKHELDGVDPKKIMRRSKAFKPYMEWVNKKENNGKFTWTGAMYGTPAMAKEVGLSEKEYWEQIIKACFLRDKNPVKKWRSVQKEIRRVRDRLNALNIEQVHVESKNIDLRVTLGKNRKFIGGRGRNIPSFELFTSPDWRGTQGHIRFTEPLYEYGTLIEDIYLEFKEGKVVKATAKKGEKVLKEMIRTENADKLGEFSLTDKRLSRITKFMGETLYDENVGGPNGNMHVALGKSYHDTFRGDPAKITKAQWKKMGFNDSVVHTDIVNTDPKTVTAFLPSGKTKVIYKNGKFLI